MQSTTGAIYRRFAEIEAKGSSTTYAEWAASIAQDALVLELISALPGMKRQANLVFAAARFAGAPVGPYPPFREWLIENWAAVVPIVMSRSTQTNEAARCAVLLPALTSRPGPIALIEAGASAGLCLYPDRYSYRYESPAGPAAIDPEGGPSVVRLPCVIEAGAVPASVPQVAWRAGVDLSPVDLADQDALRWLETLIWPEHDARRARLRAAAALVASDPPEIVRGDLLDTLPSLIDRASRHARVVVFHSLVLVYLDVERRARFTDLMASHPDVTWISNESAGVLPRIDAQVREPIGGRTVVARNGVASALAGPHGQTYRAL